MGSFYSDTGTRAVPCSWTEVQEALEYEIQWSDSEQFSWANSQTIDEPTAGVEVPSETTIYWRVRYRAEASLSGDTHSIVEWSPWHGPWSFIVTRETAGGTGDPMADGADDPMRVAPPVFSPMGGSYSSDQEVEITTSTPSATIYYTTDGWQPTIDSAQYSEPISIAGDGTSVTIRAFAVAEGMTSSFVVSSSYTIEYLSNIGFSVDLPSQPSVAFEGEPVSVPVGSDFTVTAENSEAESYSWYLDGVLLGSGQSVSLGSELIPAPYELTVVIGIGSQFYSESFLFVVET